MEAPPRKKLVAKVNFNANIYEPPAASPTMVAANVVRAKVSSSSVTRSSSVVNGGHSRNNSLARPSTPSRSQTIQFDDFKGLSSPVTRTSAPPSSVGRNYGLSPNSLLLSPDSSPSAVNRDRQQLRINPQQIKGPNAKASPLGVKFKAYQTAVEPSPISPPTSPRSQSLAMMSEPNPSQRSGNLVPQRKRVISSIRIQPARVPTAKPNGVLPSNATPGHHSRTPSVSSQVGGTAKPRATVTARAIPQQILSPPSNSQSPPTSTLSSRSSTSMVSSSLSAQFTRSISTATEGESDVEDDESFDEGRADTPQAEPDEDSIFAEEAKSNRKILDLEISNQSLLTVNSMLEATKLHQSREIRDLRRKLRETRHVPSRPLYTTSESLSPTKSDLSLPNNNTSNSSQSSDEEEPEPDPAYDRVVHLIDGLLSQAHRALDRTIDDCMPAPTNTVKVLTAVEVQRYERRALGLDDDEEGEKTDDKRSEADVSIDADEIEHEKKEAEDMAYLGEDDGTKQRLSSFSFGRRRASMLAGKPPD